MNESTSTPVQTPHLSAPLDMNERLTDGDAYRVGSTRKHRAMRTRRWRTTDGLTHPVTVSRKYA